MALRLPKDAQKKPTGAVFLKEEGIYKFIIVGNEDKKEENKESKRYGYSYHNLRFQLEDGKSLFAKVYYQNDEEDVVPEGYNFILELAAIVKRVATEENDEKTLRKLDSADSNQIINKMIKEKTPVYLATKNSTYNGVDRTNINTFTDPIGSLEEAQEFAEKKKMNVISLTSKTNDSSSDVEEEDDDDDL